MTALILAVTFGPTAPAPQLAGPSLVGEWVAVPVIDGGLAELPPEGMTVTFTKDGKCLWKEGTGKADERLYLAQPKKVPAEIDISETGADGERPMRGIYKFDGDTLVLCLGLDGTRPAAFTPSADRPFLRITLKRVAPK